MWTGDAHLAHDLPRLKLNWGADLTFYDGGWALYRPTVVERAGGLHQLNVFVEYRPSTTLNLRIEGGNLTSPRVLQAVEFYDGLRPAAPMLYRDERRLSESRYLMVRVRKTLN